jgi:hypothetical protein
MQILHRDDLHRGGFAGLREHRLVMDPKAFGSRANADAWPGIGNFVYLADARFMPKGETGMHGHKEIDVISVMVEGRIAHQGSLEHGQELTGHDVQVQRAGGEGFSHNEVNPDDQENRMIQLWVLPEIPGQPAGYKLYEGEWGKVARVYGGTTDQDETYPAETTIDVSLLKKGQNVSVKGDYLAYLTSGKGIANGEIVTDGDLFRGEALSFEASDDTQLITVYLRG